MDKIMAGTGTARQLLTQRETPPKHKATEIDIEILRKTSTPDTVILLEIPPKPPSRNKSALHQYYEENRLKLIAEAFAYGEKATKKRWKIGDNGWTNLKHRWGLPINPRGGSTKRPTPVPGLRKIVNALETDTAEGELVKKRVIIMGRVLQILKPLTRRDALWALYQAQHFIRQNGPAGALPMDTIISIVADTLGLKPEQVKSADRSKEIDEARQMAMYILYTTGRFTTIQIGQGLAGQDHSTVSYHINRLTQRLGLNSGKGFRRIIDEIQAQI